MQRIAKCFPRINSNLHILADSVLLLNAGMKTVKQIRLEKLDQLVREFGTIEAVANAAGTAPQYLSQIRNKVPSASGTPRGIGDALARKLEQGCGKPAGWMDTVEPEIENVIQGPELRGKLPLISWVRAGDLCESPDVFHTGDADEWIDCPVPHSPRSYCLRVSGDSMDGEGGYRDGEIIFVDPEVAATPGRDVVVRTPDGTMTFKRLKEDTEGLYLFGINGKKIIRIPPNTHICGVVIFSGFKR